MFLLQDPRFKSGILSKTPGGSDDKRVLSAMWDEVSTFLDWLLEYVNNRARLIIKIKQKYHQNGYSITLIPP